MATPKKKHLVEPTAQHEQKAVYPDIADHRRFSCDTPVDAVEWHNPPSIEQLTADYHAKAAEADRLQSVADDALKAADDALLALEKAGELLGLVISVDTKPKQVPQPEITDWRDLQVGDVIWWGGDSWHDCGEYTVNGIEDKDYSGYCPIHLACGEWIDIDAEEWHFIRRP